MYVRIGHFEMGDSDKIEKFGVSVNDEEELVAQTKPDQLSIINTLRSWLSLQHGSGC